MFNFLNQESLVKGYHMITKHLSLLTIAVLIGIVIGFKVTIMYLDHRITEAVILQGFVYEGTIYDVKVRP